METRKEEAPETPTQAQDTASNNIPEAAKSPQEQPVGATESFEAEQAPQTQPSLGAQQGPNQGQRPNQGVPQGQSQGVPQGQSQGAPQGQNQGPRPNPGEPQGQNQGPRPNQGVPQGQNQSNPGPYQNRSPYPNQGYPSQGYPNQGYPNQGYPNQGYPNQGYPNQGYPNQGYPNQRYPNSGYPNQGGYNNNRPPQQPPQPDPQEKESKRENRLVFWLRVVAVLLVLLMIYCIVSDIILYRSGVSGSTSSDADIATGTTNVTVVIEQQSKPDLDTEDEWVNEDGTYTVEGVAAAVIPSIVEIYTYSDTSYTTLDGTGSGIILTEDGYIITNAHVITDGGSFTVVTDDETEYTAYVVGSDSKTDIAVMKIDAEGLTAATLGDSDEVVLGEQVVAIGNPAGLTGSVTDGIVSGLNRQIRADSTGYDMNCIQTNAAISPGNSGGALVNMYGQVIGITSSKYVSSSYEGLGFAITINEVIPIVEDLIENGYVDGRVRVGITFISLDTDDVRVSYAEELGLSALPDDVQGIWITEVSEDCDIYNTELQANDVITTMEGQAVTSYDDVMDAIDGLSAGDVVEAECMRYTEEDGWTTFTISFTLMADTSGDY